MIIARITHCIKPEGSKLFEPKIAFDARLLPVSLFAVLSVPSVFAGVATLLTVQKDALEYPPPGALLKTVM